MSKSAHKQATPTEKDVNEKSSEVNFSLALIVQFTKVFTHGHTTIVQFWASTTLYNGISTAAKLSPS